MGNYKFRLVATARGPTEIEAQSGKLGPPRIAAIAARDFGPTCTTASAWCEKWAEQLGDDADAITVEVFDVLDGDKARFTLYYMPWSDSGTLFLARAARMTKLALWPDGFRPPSRDADALSEAFRTAVAAKLKRRPSKKKRK